MSQNADNGAPVWGAASSTGWGASPQPVVPLPDAVPRPFAGSVLPSSGGSNAGAPVAAPVLWLAVAAALQAVGLALGLVAADRPALSVAGWLLGGFAAILALAWFTLADSRARTDPWYSATKVPSTVRAVLAGTAVIVVAINAVQFADWASRR